MIFWAAGGPSVDPGRWLGTFDELMTRAGARFSRAEPRRRARAFVLGLLAELPRKNCWTIAEHAGDWTPDGMTCSPSSFLACENAAPVGMPVPGLRFSPGSPNAVARDAVQPAPGNRHATSTHTTVIFAVERPVVPVPCGRLGQRTGDHAAGQQFLQQVRPVQFREPVRPETRPGRDPGRELRSGTAPSSPG